MKGKLSPFPYLIRKEGCGMRLFVGLDVSLEKTAICVISEHGKMMREAQAASEPEAFTRWIREMDDTIAAIGREAGPLSQWFCRGLPVTLRQDWTSC
jgi:predicted NBD/HSP70 family sugar kinase